MITELAFTLQIFTLQRVTAASVTATNIRYFIFHRKQCDFVSHLPINITCLTYRPSQWSFWLCENIFDQWLKMTKPPIFYYLLSSQKALCWTNKVFLSGLSYKTSTFTTKLKLSLPNKNWFTIFTKIRKKCVSKISRLIAFADC